MEFKLLSITKKEMKNNSLHLEGMGINLSNVKSATKMVYVLETENGAKILLSKDILQLENHSFPTLDFNFKIAGAVSKIMPKISYKDFGIINKVKNGIENFGKLFSSSKNYERAFNYLDYIENKRSNTRIEELEISENDKAIFFAVLNAIDESYIGKSIVLELNEEESKELIAALDEEQVLVTMANSKNRIHNNMEQSKFNILNIVSEISSEYRKDLKATNEATVTVVSKKIEALRQNNPKVSPEILKSLGNRN